MYTIFLFTGLIPVYSVREKLLTFWKDTSVFSFYILSYIEKHFSKIGQILQLIASCGKQRIPA